jgi:UDP-GlcNAc:undecaprenyl-phosphate GlcNAc-1-phosphate transferase
MTDVAIRVLFFATAATALVMPPTIWALHRGALVDIETSRSSHEGTVVRGGGIAVVAGGALSLAIFSDRWAMGSSVGSALLFCLGCAVVGLVDDIASPPAPLRLIAQVVIVAVFLSAVPNEWMGAPAALGMLIAAIWLLGVVNAFNFMDGINGITAASGFIVGISLTVASLRWDADVEVAAAALAGASLGFLPFNAPRAHVFLGDVGSYAIGAGLAGLTVVAYQNGVPIVTVVLPFALYLTDTGLTLLRRVRRGASILTAHREHGYQRLVHVHGWSHTRVTALVGTLTTVTCILGHLAPRNSATTIACLAGAATVLAAYIRISGSA